MPRISIQKRLSYTQKITLLKLLESVGNQNIIPYMNRNLLYPISTELLQNKEFLSRYLLLAATLDQQADSASARMTVIQLYDNYGSDFFLKPRFYIDNLHAVLSIVRAHYKPKTRVIRLKHEAIGFLRVGGYLLSLINITKLYGGLLPYFSRCNSPQNLLDTLLADPFINGILYEKATRMYVGWLSHPNLWINVSNGKWKASSLPMVVNGHVCKVLARTGFLSDVLVESTKTMIVKARDERRRIERHVKQAYPNGDHFMIDTGAFYIGITYCDERNPKCEKCPISRVCARNTNFRAY